MQLTKPRPEVKPNDHPPSTREGRIRGLGYNPASRLRTSMIPCNLCGADRWTVISHRDRYGYPCQTTACQVCGLTVLNPRMTAVSYRDFYKRIYRPLVSAYHGRRIDAKTVQEGQWGYAEEMARLLAPYLQKRRGALFLDVGGSTGVVATHFARQFGMKATVVDPAPAEIAEAKALGITAITSLVEDWHPEGIRYDVIGMFQTIDHLLDVTGTLAKLRSIISPRGVFIVDIVDFRAVYLRNWSVEAAIKLDHPYSLTEETMELYLARTGFGVLRKAYTADQHVAYICEPRTPVPNALPANGEVGRFMRELRLVQNAPIGARSGL